MKTSIKSVKRVNTPTAYYCCRTVVKEIFPFAGNAVNLPQKLVIPPGVYRVHGRTYNLKQEGLYRFFFPCKDNQQRIVYRRDRLALISALSWIQTHGNRDSWKDVKALKKQALTEKLIITCGCISNFAYHVITGLGISCRCVGSFTLKDLNTYNTGHVFIEIKLNRKWTLADLDIGVLFRYKGRRLSLIEFARHAKTGQYKMEPLNASTPISTCCFKDRSKTDGYDYGLWMETYFCGSVAIRKWYRRIMMVPYIDERDILYMTTKKNSDIETAKRYWDICKFLECEEFINKFYKDNKKQERRAL